MMYSNIIYNGIGLYDNCSQRVKVIAVLVTTLDTDKPYESLQFSINNILI